MQISPPFGYKEIVPFLKTQRVRMPSPGEFPEFVRQGHALPVSFAEFKPATRDYPVVFTSVDGGRSYMSVAVLGISPGENLLCDASGWESGAYIPAYARRHPFCMSRVSVNNVERKDRLICVEKTALDEGGELLFEANGEPLERWKDLERLLAEFETDAERAREMCSILADYGLLESFSMQATFKDESSSPVQVTGMHRVAEQRLENLNAAQLKNLVRKGILARVYMHLLSLDNYGRLLERKGARQKAA